MTRKTMLTMASVLALALAAGAAQAQDAAPKAGFAAMDFDGDGKITAADFTARKLAQQKALDTDGDGALTLEEMKAHAGEEARLRAEARAERRFKSLDTDGDGRLSAVEALSADGRGGRGRGIEHFIARADADKDGAVSPEEYEAARKAMRERGPGKERGWGPKGGHHERGPHGGSHGRHGHGPKGGDAQGQPAQD